MRGQASIRVCARRFSSASPPTARPKPRRGVIRGSASPSPRPSLSGIMAVSRWAHPNRARAPGSSFACPLCRGAVMRALSSETLHASGVAIRGHAVLIEGRSGSGKSDLALRLIDRGGVLVSDDQVIVRRDGTRAVANPPETIAGKFEVRGLGIVAMPIERDVPVSLIVSLVESEVERMPAGTTRAVAGIELPLISIRPFEASAAAKIAVALD